MGRFAALRIYAEVVITLLMARVGLIRPSIGAGPAPGSVPQSLETGVAARAAHVAGITDRVSRRLFRRGQCLVRATALQHLLTRRGIATELRIGVRKEGGVSIASHAWVELGGEVLIGRLPDLGSYGVLEAGS